MKKLKRMIGSVLLVSLFLQPISADAYTKKETVYQTLDAKGNPTTTLVHNHLYLKEKGQVVDDTLLKEILNNNGSETFTKKERVLTWDAKGKDIFYEGKTEEKSPIIVKATYYLDEKQMQPKKMIGKKGTVKIALSFENTSYQEAKKIYTPFVVTVAGALSSKENRHVEITNGKVVDTGSQNLMMALAAPGLYESTGINAFSSFDTVTITYETNKFKKNELYIIATPKLLSEADFDVFVQMNQFSSSFQKLGTSMEEIVHGAQSLEAGGKTLHSGVSTICTHLVEALRGVRALLDGSLKLQDGFDQVQSALTYARAQLNELDLQSTLTTYITLQEQNKKAIEQLQATNKILEDTYMQYGLAAFQTEEALISTLQGQGVRTEQIQNLLVCKRTYEGNQQLITLLSYNNKAFMETATTLSPLSAQVLSLLTQLEDAISNLADGSLALSDGLQTLEEGMKQLKDGAVQLENGVVTFENGLATLGGGVVAFQQQGIKPLLTYANALNHYQEKFTDLVQSSKDYHGFVSNNANNTIFISKLCIQ